jgi:CRP-like cAMP-binding protein
MLEEPTVTAASATATRPGREALPRGLGSFGREHAGRIPPRLGVDDNPLLRALNQTADSLAGGTGYTDAPEGTVLFHQGDLAGDMCLVVSGKVKLSRRSGETDRVVALLGPGDQCGALSLIEGVRHTETAEMLAGGTVARISREALDDWMVRYPDVSLHLLQVVANGLRRTRADVADAVFLDVAGRIAKQLLRLAGRFGVRQRNELHVRYGLNQAELAQLVGASRESVNKTLSDFASRGWIRYSGNGSLVVVDPARLAHRAH